MKKKNAYTQEVNALYVHNNVVQRTSKKQKTNPLLINIKK